ncbi:hypothetical protein P4H27_05290 [Paenibacillus taichungensis]|uniref:hypothetical protein n=1 Tax=Paenibacillus TaxID=44249 RepID=UPI00088A6F93|nr:MULTISPECIES: hypothetical protein [Paenibacillus]MDR9743821.1 hypothetical protein [Paenibacillus taichungensis]MEC0106348.1 hypothetical protein [Paenibacillus taichungensis]MEC0197095.1 hypothetical protein [Paenibacillus taichungensis]SDL15533.1 hypothetical protein SAMN05428961_10496 [Paenibacillus sp. OK060]SEB02116.1 hypothetical protein SAMN03159332_2961 [Paenibacillus sp. 276b]
MNKDFLYTKPYVPGIIDDTPVDLESWFLDDSRERMEEKLRNIPLNDLIIELINIFKDGDPNYQVLLGLLGEKVVKEAREDKIVYCLADILRADDDIQRIEIEIDDEGLNIKKMNVFVIPAELLVLQKEITSLFVDIQTQKTSNYLSISIKDKMITLFSI